MSYHHPDSYPEAAVRHYIDGRLLQQNNRYDNAMCHYAFSAECAVKAFIGQFEQVYTADFIDPQNGHRVAENLQGMTDYHELLGILYPEISLFVGLGTPPPILFRGHPARRYWNDIKYTANDLAACESFAAQLSAWIVSAAIDGKLEYTMERDAR